MAEAYYEPTPATDGATMNPVPGASFQVFEIADTAFATPLSLRVGSGNPTTTVTASDTLATLPGVYVTSPNYEHIWKSGTFEWRRDSIDGAKKAIEQAKIAAVDVQTRAQNGEFKGDAGPQGAAGPVSAVTVGVVETVAGSPLDAEVVADQISTPGTLANTALSATIASEVAPLESEIAATSAAVEVATPGIKAAFFGDSIENYGEGYPNYAAILSSQRVRRHQRISYPGANTATLLTHITDVTEASDKSQVCIIKGGTNDALSSLPVATVAANLTAMVDAVKAAGITPVLGTVPPVNTKVSDVQRYNLWIARYAAQNGIQVVDFYAGLADATTGGWVAAYDSGDGVHPSAAGNRQMGKIVADTLGTKSPSVASLLPVSDAGINLLPGGLFTVDANIDGIPDNWSISAGYAGITSSRQIDATIPGRVWRSVLSAAPAAKEWNRSSVTTGFIAGDRMLAVARIRTLQSGATTSAELRWDCLNSGLLNLQSNQMTGGAGLSQAVDGIAMVEFTVPTNTMYLKPYWRLGAGDGTYELAQMGLYNLTAIGG